MRIDYDCAGCLMRLAVPPPYSLVLHPADDADRGPVESFIATTYEARFGASLDDFAPLLVSLRRGDALVAAAGVRRAPASLFLEAYLGEPLEARLGRLGHTGVPRQAVAEVGQLATRHPRHLRALMAMLAAHLCADGVDWVGITATRELRQTFGRLGMSWQTLVDADAACAGIDPGPWGDYYAHDPQVIAGRLSENCARLEPAPGLRS